MYNIRYVVVTIVILDLSTACEDDLFRCGDGQCISPQNVCDGYFDCLDYSDEDNTICGTCASYLPL